MNITVTMTEKEKAAILKAIAATEERHLLYLNGQGHDPGCSTADLAQFAKVKIKLQPEKYASVMAYERAIEATADQESKIKF